MKKFLLIFLILLSGSFLSSQERLANSNDVGLYYHKIHNYFNELNKREFGELYTESIYNEVILREILSNAFKDRITIIGNDRAYLRDQKQIFTFKAENSTTDIMSKLIGYLNEGYYYQISDKIKITDIKDLKSLYMLYLLYGANEFISDPETIESGEQAFMLGNFTTNGVDIFINIHVFLQVDFNYDNYDY